MGHAWKGPIHGGYTLLQTGPKGFTTNPWCQTQQHTPRGVMTMSLQVKAVLAAHSELK